MNLGNFSVSLAVKDIHKSIKFYETLGFTQVSGNIDENWIVLQNGYARIGLFQGMFEDNLLTFNPKWNNQGQAVEGEDVREIAKAMEEHGAQFTQPLETQGSEGPGYFMVKDPDGNTLLFDQFV